MVQVAKTRKTVDDYMALPDDVRVELFGGEFFRMPSPGFIHQSVIMELAAALHAYVKAKGLGQVLVAPFDTILSEEDVVQPDILFLSHETLSRVEERLHGPPDVAIEVLSKTHAERDRIVKHEIYRKFGLPEYWIVDPEERTIEVLILEETKWRLHGIYGEADALSTPTFPDLELAVKSVFS